MRMEASQILLFATFLSVDIIYTIEQWKITPIREVTIYRNNNTEKAAAL